MAHSRTRIASAGAAALAAGLLVAADVPTGGEPGVHAFVLSNIYIASSGEARTCPAMADGDLELFFTTLPPLERAKYAKPGCLSDAPSPGMPGPWVGFISGFGEMLPNPNNRVTLHPTRTDKWGIPIVHVECSHGDNEKKMAGQIIEDAKAMLQAAGGMVVHTNGTPGTPGLGVHEMGTACMGKDPKKSVLNKYNQAHDVPNLFITDGSAMASSGCQNPSLSYMALSARAPHHAVQFLRDGKI